jgi:hypothetical protein
VHLVYANEMFGNYEVYHTTLANGRWAVPKNVSHTSGVSTQPALTFDEYGTPFVVWTDTTEGLARVYYAWLIDGAWNTYWVQDSGGGSAPDVALGTDGRVWLVWQAKDANGYDVFRLFGSDHDWIREAQNVSVSANADSLGPRLAVVPGVGAFLVWQEQLGGGTAAYGADTVGLSDWFSDPAAMSQASAHAVQPSVAADGAGEVHLAWDAGDQLLYRRREFSAGEWLPQSAIVQDPADPGEVELAASVGWQVHIMWSRVVGTGNRDVYYRVGRLVMPHHIELPLLFSSP